VSTAVDTEHFKQRLLDERARVQEALDYLHEENPGSMEDETQEIPSDNHPADYASITVDREIDYTLEENSEQVLSSIDGALGRIDDGTYGHCVNCGHAIAQDRLAAIPWATHCIECKRLEERG